MSLSASVLRSLRTTPLRSSRCLCPTTSRFISSSPSRFSEPTPATESSTSPKIKSIVDSISVLTLLEAAELVSALKTTLNIQEIAMPAGGGGGAAPAAAAAPVEEAEPEEKPKEKTLFTVRLQSFDAASKAKVIREVKGLVPNLNLVEAKKFVESVPQVLKENMTKEDAAELETKMKALGCVVLIE